MGQGNIDTPHRIMAPGMQDESCEPPHADGATHESHSTSPYSQGSSSSEGSTRGTEREFFSTCRDPSDPLPVESSEDPLILSFCACGWLKVCTITPPICPPGPTGNNNVPVDGTTYSLGGFISAGPGPAVSTRDSSWIPLVLNLPFEAPAVDSHRLQPSQTHGLVGCTV